MILVQDKDSIPATNASTYFKAENIRNMDCPRTLFIHSRSVSPILKNAIQ